MDDPIDISKILSNVPDFSKLNVSLPSFLGDPERERRTRELNEWIAEKEAAPIHTRDAVERLNDKIDALHAATEKSSRDMVRLTVALVMLTVVIVALTFLLVAGGE